MALTLEKIYSVLFPTWGISKLIKELYHSYHLQSSDLVEKTKGILKLKLFKLSEIFELPWHMVSLFMS